MNYLYLQLGVIIQGDPFESVTFAAAREQSPYEVFGVILIIFIKYGLEKIDIYNNNRFYLHNMAKMTTFNFYA